MMLSRELTDSEWAEGTPWRRMTARVSSRAKRASITTSRRRSDRLPPSNVRPNPLAKTTTIRSHRPRYTEARLSPKSGRTLAPRLTICILVKVSLPIRKLLSFPFALSRPSFLRSRRKKYSCSGLRDGFSSSAVVVFLLRSELFVSNRRRCHTIAKPLEISFIDDVEYLQSISNRIYLEEAGYWGLIALREREKEYLAVRNANKKYFG